MKWTKMNLRFVYVFVVLFLCCVFCTGSFIEIPECTGKEGCLIPTKNLTDPDFEGMIIYGTEKPVPPPEALSMLSEDENHEVEYAPTDPTMMSTSTSGNVSDEPKGRALNFSVEPGQDNKISKSTTSGKVKDLSDVSMDDEEEEGDQEKVTVSSLERNMTRLGICMLGGLTYENGEKLEHACDSVCTCANGKMDCVDRCVHPYVKKGSKPTDPLCTEKSSDDPCCSTWFCASDIETEPFEMCTYKNKTYQRSEKFEDGCQSVCHCEAAGKVTCRPRCPEMEHKTTDRCVEVPDQSDPCCKKLLCDVTLDDNESEKDDKFHPKILTASLVNKTAIRIKFNSIVDENNLPEVQLSTDKMSWKTYKLKPEGLLSGFQEDPKYVKIHGSSEIVEITKTENSEDAEASGGHQSCEYKGKMYKLNEEFNDNCTSFCVCKNSGVHCLKIECPTYFGVDVLDPTCVEWQTVPEDFVPSPPNCCPKEVRCKNNGSCSYAGEIYTNWQEIPSNVTGCEKKCYCEMGKIECQNICPPVTAFPPANIGCPQHEATLSHLAGDDCCMYWICNSTTTNSVFTGPEGDKENATKGVATDSTFGGPVNIWPAKQPSKTSGPLLIYANKNTDKDPVFGIHVPNIKKEENYYFEKNSSHKNPNNITKPFTKNTSTFLGPFSPNYKTDVSNTKQTKVSGGKYNKPGKDSGADVNESKTKRPPFDNTKYSKVPKHPSTNQTEFYATEQYPQIPHASGQSDEILQIINQHPELANYPPGSVFEIHSVPVDPSQKPNRPQYANPNILVPSTNDHPLVPFVINQNPQVVPSHGIDLDQLLQHIHRAPTQPNYIQYPTHSSNGIIIPNGQNLPIPSQLNKTISGGQIFSGFPNIPPNGMHRNQDEIVVHSVEAVDAHTIRLEFSVPPIIVGLHGQVEVRYTSKLSDQLDDWNLQVFTPPDEYISTPQMEFDLLGLEADTEYKIKITVILRGLHNTPTSEVYNVRTPKETGASLPPMIPIDPKLEITDVNSTWVTVIWRKFADQELQLIDGIQLRYKEIDGKIYQATPLIHRMVTTYTLDHLKPNTKYEVGIFFIPFEGQTSELHYEHMLHFTTANEVDTYGFNVTLEITNIKATSVEITWYGVPYPQDKYVNIYRAIYQTPSGKGDFSTFKIAKRDSTPKTIIKDLNPRTKYRLWLEVYLTNGKIKTSNVKDFTTKSSPYPPKPSQIVAGELFDAEMSKQNKSDYYGALVVVAIIAALAIVSTVVLLMVLFKRHSQKKAAITAPSQRVSQSAYDNPTYKVEIQQETMGMSTIK
ncbi:putative epidermal cell surface receptor isoform X1 [Agrilus planipennis]|uniref:Epidermal cell surface receptor isoform X1 n=1 Tax=Agrilus planipennis TaxID=224129 RepID=A0A1W4WEV4_AGRPL|nr:putative epidermal cell surface receptor isoform X1 [Agrilus planipennis]